MDYDMIIDELCTDRIAEEVVSNNYGKPIEEIAFLIEEEYKKYESTIWFPSNRIWLYPSVKIRKAAKYYETPNGIIISPNTMYINYHALLINETKKTKYVLNKPLRFEVCDKYPLNISELEELERSKNLDISLKKVRNH
nr:hypothetical protein [Bacilli bacterium]